MLSVQLLGRPQMTLDGQPLDITRRKSRALVYYLAAHERPLNRDHLLGLLWLDLDRPAAQQTLRVTIHNLRQTLADALIVDRETLALGANVEVDARIFDQRLSLPVSDSELLQATLKLYHGDFIEGFELPDSSEFDDWVTAEREHYRRLAIRGYAVLAEQYEKQQNLAGAIEAIESALAFDPLQEDLQRSRLRLLYLRGDRARAIRSYEAFRKLLKEEMGVPPMAETRALYDAIINETPLTSANREPVYGNHPRLRNSLAGNRERVSEQLPFVGRDAQLEVLSAAFEGNRLFLIEGEPGIGKTRLAEEFIRISQELPIVGVAHEFEHTIPYHPIIEALRELISQRDWPALAAGIRASMAGIWQAEIARLVPELAAPLASAQRAVQGKDESRLWEAINQFLVGLGRQKPVIVFLDDLQWAEAATLGVLAYLVRQKSSTPVRFLAATRPFAPRSPLSALVQTLTREGRLTRLSLPRLETTEVNSIASHLTAKYAFPLAEWLVRTSEGNPYVLSELVRYARENRLLLDDGVVNLDKLSTSPIVPQTVYSLVQSRLQQLSDEARRVLDAAVAIGREFEFDLVAGVAALSEDAALDALDELTVARLIHPLDGSRYRFDHSLTMEVAYREVSEPRHTILHRRVAEVLESIHSNSPEKAAGLLAWHFSEGNSPERAAPYALQAAQKAVDVAAWAEAIAFYEQALAGLKEGQRMPVLMALGQARLNAGQAVQASEAFRVALSLAQSAADANSMDEARLALVTSFLFQARYGEAIALAQEVRESGLPESAVSAEFNWGTALSLEGADLGEAERHLHIAEALCTENMRAKNGRLAQIKFELGSIAAQQGDLLRAIGLYRETLEIAQQLEEQEAQSHLVFAYNNLAYHLLLLNDPTAKEYGLNGLRLAEEKGLVGLKPFLLSTMGEIALAEGELDAAEARFAEGLAIAQQLNMPERIAGLIANLGLLALKRGQITLAIHRFSTAVAQADGLGTRHLAAQIRLWLVPLLPPDEARVYLAEARNIAESGNRRRLLEEVTRLEETITAI